MHASTLLKGIDMVERHSMVEETDRRTPKYTKIAEFDATKTPGIARGLTLSAKACGE